MGPLWFEFMIPRKAEKPFRFAFPLLIVWLLLSPVLAIAVFLWIIASLFLLAAGYGFRGFLMLWGFFTIIYNLKGLTVDVKDGDDKVFFKVT